MHTSTISNQTDCTRTLARYDGAGPGEYLSDSNSYNDNDSDCRSDDYNNYESNYESDNEEASCASTSTTEAVKERKVNVTYTLRQKNFNDKFSPKDLLNAIQGILSSSPRDMSDDKGSLDCLPIYSFLFPNEKGSSLYNAYDRSEVENKLVIKIDQDADHAPNFLLPITFLKAVIDIDASQEDMEATGVKAQEVFFRICLSFIRALYRILDYSWEDILNGLVIATSSDPSKLYTITGEKFGKYIDRGLPGQNFNLRLIGSAKKGRVKRILQFSLDNGWNELDHARVQPPTNLGLKTIEEKDSENFIYFNRKAPLECPLCKRIHDKDQRDEPGEVFECDPSIAEKIQQENKNLSPTSCKVKDPGFPKVFIKMPSWSNIMSPLQQQKRMRRDILDLKSYCDIDGNINLSDHKRVVCQIESLHRIANKCKCNKKCKCPPSQYDLWLDEIVSIIAQAQSHLAGQLIEKLYKLVQDARRIIVMDNDLTDLNIEWIKALRKDKLFSIIHNTFQPQKGKTFRLAPNKETVLAELWDWAKHMASLPFESRTSASLIWPFLAKDHTMELFAWS
ncbi:unnamed protein product [Rhizophagus irregularis]|nr:unnamed protein product [Rhizophagus irregularis]